KARWTAISGIASPSTVAATPPAGWAPPTPGLASRVASAPGVGDAGVGACPRTNAADIRLRIVAASHGFRTCFAKRRMELLLVPGRWVVDGIRVGQMEWRKGNLGRPVARPPCRKTAGGLYRRSGFAPRGSDEGATWHLGPCIPEPGLPHNPFAS